MEDLVIQFLIKSRKNGEVLHVHPDAHSESYLEESRAWNDTWAEQHYTKRELGYYDREIARDGVSLYNNSMPFYFNDFDNDEKKSLMLFYRAGDCGLRSAVLRALHYGLLMSSRLNRG